MKPDTKSMKANFAQAVPREDLPPARLEDPRVAAIMHNVRQYAIDFEAHTGESTSNLDILRQRIEDGVRELAGLRAVQPELPIAEAEEGVGWLVEYGAIDLPFGHPSRVTVLSAHYSYEDALCVFSDANKEYQAQMYSVPLRLPHGAKN